MNSGDQDSLDSLKKEYRLRRLIEAAIQDLGAPRMTYAPSVEIKELRNMVKRVSRNLLKGLKENFNVRKTVQ